jgi:hypothetical protein
MKHQNSYNFFKVGNLSGIELPYRLVEVNDSKLAQDNKQRYEENLHRLAYKVGSDTKGPAAVVKKGKKPFIAIPADRQIKKIKHQLTPFVVDINPLEEVKHLRFNDSNSETFPIKQQFLEFAIKNHLTNNPNLWRYSGNNFFLKKPVNAKTESSIDVFGGFNFNLIQLEDGEWYVCLDITYKYASRQYLSDLVTVQNKNEIGNRFKNMHAIYQYGDNWFVIQIMGFGESITEQTFSDQNGNEHDVYNYTMKNAPSKNGDLKEKIDPATVSIVYKRPYQSMNEKFGAACLTKLLYKNEDPDVKPMHGYSIKEPDKRFRYMVENIKRNFSGINFGKQKISVSPAPLKRKAKSFLIPDLLFNNHQVLRAKDLIDSNTKNLKEYGKARKKLLKQNGVLKNTSFDPQYILIPAPDSVSPSLAEAIKRDLDEQMKKLAPRFPGYQLVPYEAKNNVSAYEQVQVIKEALDQQNIKNGCVLFILPDLHNDDKHYLDKLHDIFKKKYYPDLKFQCALQSNIVLAYQSYPDSDGEIEHKVSHNQGKFFTSYSFYLALQKLLLNRKWPYSLKDSLNYNVYIGLDVHERYVGFCFFYENGEQIIFEKEEIPKQSGGKSRHEKINKRVIADKIYKRLRKDIQQGIIQPQSIVLLRDGRSYDQDLEALTGIIEKLQKEGLVKDTAFNWGVVDLYKTSMLPFRMATETGGRDHLQNPRIGSYETFNAQEGALITTGYPFSLRGTANPLQVKISAGNVDLVNVLQDIFAQSMLAFSVPEKSSSLPITIKLNDVMLEPLAITLSEEDLKFTEANEVFDTEDNF